jgi:hypothetical protein
MVPNISSHHQRISESPGVPDLVTLQAVAREDYDTSASPAATGGLDVIETWQKIDLRSRPRSGLATRWPTTSHGSCFNNGILWVWQTDTKSHRKSYKIPYVHRFEHMFQLELSINWGISWYIGIDKPKCQGLHPHCLQLSSCNATVTLVNCG